MAAGVSAILFSLAQVSFGTPKQREKIIKSSAIIIKKNSAITINAPIVYMARDIMILMRVTSITRAIGRAGQKIGSLPNSPTHTALWENHLEISSDMKSE